MTSDGNARDKMNIHKGLGLVSDVFTDLSVDRLNGRLGLGMKVLIK